jgi:alpha-beta hydrolase superfamily lysophospholipase
MHSCSQLECCCLPGEELVELSSAPEPEHMRVESVRLRSQEDELAASLFLPGTSGKAPTVIVCHGAGEFKENYFEMCEALASQGVAALALDMRGHGESGGERFHVMMSKWVADIQAAADFLSHHPGVDAQRLGAFGLSSGGTAVLEAGLLDPRLKALVVADATVRNSAHWWTSLLLKSLLLLGRMKQRLTGHPLRVPLARISIGPKLASDPEVNRKLLSDPRSLEAFMAVPFPGAEEVWFVDTMKLGGRITVPTLVLWGEEDKLDSPKTGRLLFAALGCKKRLEIVPGNGHAGHRDRNRARVFAATSEWVLANTVCPSRPALAGRRGPAPRARCLEGEVAKRLTPHEKWELLSPYLKQYGRQSLSYATLQEGMEYFIDELGYIAYTTVRHPVLARRPKRIVLTDPVCDPEDLPQLLYRFLSSDPRASFAVVSEPCAEVLRQLGFKVNCIGYEPEILIQSYNTRGNWKELDLIKRARNEATREGLVIREEDGATLSASQLAAVSAKWIGTKKINDREIWLYARRPVFGREEDVRKFVAYDKEGTAVGFVFYDPMYWGGEVFGYSANISRCDEQRFGRLATAVHMVAAEKFKVEGKTALNLLLAPFVKLREGKYNDDRGMKWFFELSARYGNSIYNFNGLSFHKSKYRGVERSLYCASNSRVPMNDIYLAFLSADITRGYFSTVGQLLGGILSANRKRKSV